MQKYYTEVKGKNKNKKYQLIGGLTDMHQKKTNKNKTKIGNNRLAFT